MIAAIPDLAAKRAELTPDKVAIEEIATGRSLTYAELDRRAGAAAALMAEQGVGEGDRVAVLCRNRGAFFELLFGCAKLGAILVPLNWRMPPPELALLMKDAEPRLLLYGSEDAERAAAVAEGVVTIGLDAEYEVLLEAAPSASFRTEWPAEAIWYLIYTSGTTGLPKGVINNFRMALANHVNIGSTVELGARDTVASFLPNFHTAGINLHALPALISGATVLVLPDFDADSVVTLFEQRRLDIMFGVPSVYASLLDHPRFASSPLHHVRHWGCGGAPMPPALLERYRALGIRLCNGMGMTETGPTAFLVDPADAWRAPGSVGKPRLLVSVRIVDEAGVDVRQGEVGELLFRGPGVTPGYWRDPIATAAAFTDDGWLRSGDLARRDEDGLYHVVGRRKEMFISGGENVYPVEIEAVLAAHPAVAEAAVVTVSDTRWGEVGWAFLRLADGVEPPQASDLAAFCRGRLAPYKIPAGFEFVADFPRTAAGKIQKHQLRGPGARAA
jgi:fatty-acyl-CoA synthase